MDDNDVRVADPGGALRLAPGAFEEGGEFGVVELGLGVELLHGDLAAEEFVVGAPDGGHPAPADAVEDEVSAGDQPSFVGHRGFLFSASDRSGRRRHGVPPADRTPNGPSPTTG
ncbi:hypothetical protein GCM10010269_56240 [Streptomyces humidus]|uniref:Uncharacterized protein n=1 Tax=Streptomyces humidus TaxID=52259 RepID=A0A918L5L1_9ACTN|nr:hypothetical protein GCM10010269_56240 [Streptomyces humidus]